MQRKQPNKPKSAGMDAGCAVLFAFERASSGTTQRKR